MHRNAFSMWQTHPLSHGYCCAVTKVVCCLKLDRNLLSFAVQNSSSGDDDSEHVDEDDTIQKEVCYTNKEGLTNCELFKANGECFSFLTD